MGGQAVKLTPDTNVLVRALVRDDPRQAQEAERTLAAASGIALTLTTLCELVWVLRSGYRLDREEISIAIRRLVDAAGVEADHAAVDAGLAMLDAGGDFADGVIAHEGAWLGGEEFVSFDRDAVSRLHAQGVRARLL